MTQNRDCSQIEDRDEEEILEWDEKDELKEQREEDEKVEERFKTKQNGRRCMASGGHAKGTGVGSA